MMFYNSVKSKSKLVKFGAIVLLYILSGYALGFYYHMTQKSPRL
jgi:hypothetical protein